MDLESVSLRLPRDLLSGAQRVATARDVTVGHLVRELLKREVARQLGASRDTAPDMRLIAALGVLLERDLLDATCWENLTHRLAPHGYEFRLIGGGIVLYKTSCGTRVCKGSDLGFGYGEFVRRFGAPMPAIQVAPGSQTHHGIMPAGRIDPTRRKIVTDHFATARNWPDLIHRLAVEGLELRAMGAGLGVYVSGTGRHLCNSVTVGARYQTLVQRFGAAMPDHPFDVSGILGGQAEDDPSQPLISSGDPCLRASE